MNMNKLLKTLLFALPLLAFITSCKDDDDSYAELRERERKLVSAFIKNGCEVNDANSISLSVKPIKVISLDTFIANDSTTNVSENEYVYFPTTGLYMQIVRKGTGKPLKQGESATVICRYIEYNIGGDSIQSTNRSLLYAAMPEVLNVTNNYGTLSGTFTSGVMLSYYGSSVPSGWLTPINYINLGRLTNKDDELALVRVIVPSTIGQSNQSSSVYPCFFEISYQRGR